MSWHIYCADFFAGVFLANAVPHFVNGISGNGFPTPFAKPPGKGLSSPTVNVAWGLLNLIAGYFLFRAGHVAGPGWGPALVCFAGAAAISLPMSAHFAGKEKR